VDKHTECKPADILAAFRHHGLGTDGHFQEILGRLVALKALNPNWREVYFLNVKPLGAKGPRRQLTEIPLD
jgi:hypothetical protein